MHDSESPFAKELMRHLRAGGTICNQKQTEGRPRARTVDWGPRQRQHVIPPAECGSATPLWAASNSAAITNDGAECICFKALARGRMVFRSRTLWGVSRTSSARRPDLCRRRRRRGAEINIVVQFCENWTEGRSRKEIKVCFLERTQ